MDAVQNGKLSFTPDSNQSQIRRANGTLRTKGWAKALADWTADVREGKCGDEQVALGAALLNQAGNSKVSGTEYLDILSDYVTMMHNAGKELQAGKLLQQLTPDGKLYMAKRPCRTSMASSAAGKARKPGTRRTLRLMTSSPSAIPRSRRSATSLARWWLTRSAPTTGFPVEDWAKEMMGLSAEARPSRS